MRKQCTKDNPYTPERDLVETGYGWNHDAIYEIKDTQKNGWPSGDTVMLGCKSCRLTWESELSQ